MALRIASLPGCISENGDRARIAGCLHRELGKGPLRIRVRCGQRLAVMEGCGLIGNGSRVRMSINAWAVGVVVLETRYGDRGSFFLREDAIVSSIFMNLGEF